MGDYTVGHSARILEDASLKMLSYSTWLEQIEYISQVQKLSDGLALIKIYNSFWNRNYYDDQIRHYYRFLKDFSLDSAITLYDNLLDQARSNMIYSIGFDHPHLKQMIEIHNIITDTLDGDVIVQEKRV